MFYNHDGGVSISMLKYQCQAAKVFHSVVDPILLKGRGGGGGGGS